MPLRFDDDAAPNWLELNRANWEERLPLHLASDLYDMSTLLAGKGNLHPIEEEELGAVDGLDILHLQCRFGFDSLALAQRGARVTGIDFDRAAIAKAKSLAEELDLSDRATFFDGNVLEADKILTTPANFDRVFVTWGTICWLPDIKTWARVIAHFLKPGGWLYFADHHPIVSAFDDEFSSAPDMPTFFWPYFSKKPLIDDAGQDYASGVQLKSGNLHEWLHTTGDIVTALLEAGLTITMLREHDGVPWQAYGCLVEGPDRLHRWPDKPWLPLAISIKAEKP